MTNTEKTTYTTSLGTSSRDDIKLLGHDLAEDLMGKISFGELAYWLVAMRRPTSGELRVFETVLVALADHGFTPTAIASRLTYLSAPESIQGALAAGLLGGGSRFLGVTEDCGQFLAATLAANGSQLPKTDKDWDELARNAIQTRRSEGKFVPGLGHPNHKDGDPRTPVLFAIAEQEDQLGPHLQLFRAIGRVSGDVLGRNLPLNGAGVCGAALADIGLPTSMLRGFALLARAAGLLGHIAEEERSPIADEIYFSVDHHAVYAPPSEH